VLYIMRLFAGFLVFVAWENCR